MHGLKPTEGMSASDLGCREVDEGINHANRISTRLSRGAESSCRDDTRSNSLPEWRRQPIVIVNERSETW